MKIKLSGYKAKYFDANWFCQMGKIFGSSLSTGAFQNVMDLLTPV